MTATRFIGRRFNRMGILLLIVGSFAATTRPRSSPSVRPDARLLHHGSGHAGRNLQRSGRRQQSGRSRRGVDHGDGCFPRVSLSERSDVRPRHASRRKRQPCDRHQRSRRYRRLQRRQRLRSSVSRADPGICLGGRHDARARGALLPVLVQRPLRHEPRPGDRQRRTNRRRLGNASRRVLQACVSLAGKRDARSWRRGRRRGEQSRGRHQRHQRNRRHRQRTCLPRAGRPEPGARGAAGTRIQRCTGDQQQGAGGWKFSSPPTASPTRSCGISARCATSVRSAWR